MIRAVLFDFNGTLSDDEPVLCAIWREIFAGLGKPLAEKEYYARLAGLADPEIAETWLGADHPALAEAIADRVRLYSARVADGSTVSDAMRDAVRYAAERVGVGVVSGALRPEIDAVLAAAGLADSLSVLVSAQDVRRGKPDPEPYLVALDRLNRDPAEVLVFEDTEAGVQAAKAAGTSCIALVRTMEPERLAAADELVERIDAALLRRLLG